MLDLFPEPDAPANEIPVFRFHCEGDTARAHTTAGATKKKTCCTGTKVQILTQQARTQKQRLRAARAHYIKRKRKRS
jgi:hypothetical protein